MRLPLRNLWANVGVAVSIGLMRPHAAHVVVAPISKWITPVRFVTTKSIHD